jgi:hypothetical protein
MAPMTHLNKVMQSINDGDGLRCVDIFRRPDATFGFEEYRRDPEDPRGWAAIGGHDLARFETAETALAAARERVAWLAPVLPA